MASYLIHREQAKNCHSQKCIWKYHLWQWWPFYPGGDELNGGKAKRSINVSTGIKMLKLWVFSSKPFKCSLKLVIFEASFIACCLINLWMARWPITWFNGVYLDEAGFLENEDVVGAAPAGDAPSTSERSTILLPTEVWLVLEVWQYYKSKSLHY